MTLDEIRAEIDKIDSKMKELFIKRMECARHVAEVKVATGGDVYVPEREQVILERRSSDMDMQIRGEYTAFQRHLMSVCRRYEYGLLDMMQEQTVSEALERSGFTADTEHSRVEIEFCCDYARSTLNLFINMADLNQVGILELKLRVQDGRQEVVMTLEGNVKDPGMKRLLCQIGKEAEAFRIVGLY